MISPGVGSLTLFAVVWSIARKAKSEITFIILTLPIAYQILQATLILPLSRFDEILHFNILYKSDMEQQAVAVGLIGFFALYLGVQKPLSGVRVSTDVLFAQSGLRSHTKILTTYLFFKLLVILGSWSGPFYQIFHQINIASYTLLCLLVLYSILHKKFMRRTLLVIVLETISSFGGYFSGFKIYLILFLMVFLFIDVLSPQRLSAASISRRLFTATFGFIFVALMSVWQAIKSSYRSFVSLGSGQQEVVVSQLEIFRGVAALMQDVTINQVFLGLMSGLNRLSQHQYLAGVLEHVPKAVPYQSGQLFFEALTFLVPRAFWSAKPVGDDSLRTNTYSGFSVATADEGASIGIGYVAEAYVDFGYAGIIYLYATGFFLGALLKYFKKFPVDLFVCILSAFGAQYLLLFEMSMVKILPGSILFVLVMLICAPLFNKLTLRGRD